MEEELVAKATTQEESDPQVEADSLYNVLPSPKCIRLLNLEPALDTSSSSDITATLHTYLLAKAPPYKALSYTWGNPYHDNLDNISEEDAESPPEFVQTIECNLRPHKVTQNLHNALTSFRRLGITGLFWIDALCINQSDHEERSSQVSQMGEVYSSAEVVVVWLGHDREGAADLAWAATEFIPLIRSSDSTLLEPKAKSMFNPSSIYGDEDWQQVGLQENPTYRLVKASCFERHCRWSTRSWTLQEVMLAKNVQMVAGNYEFSLRNAMELAEICQALTWNNEIAHQMLLKDRSLEDPDAFWELRILRALVTSFGRGIKYTLFGEDPGPISALSYLLIASRKRFCFDKRDKIYSMLGIIAVAFPEASIPQYIVPNYDISAQSVIIMVTTLMLRNAMVLDIISDTRQPVGSTALPGLPSWSLKYLPYQQPLSIFLRDRSVDATRGEHISSYGFEINGAILYATGVHFDTLRNIQPDRLNDLYTPMSQARTRLLRFVLSLPSKKSTAAKFKTLQNTLMMNNERRLIPSSVLEGAQRSTGDWMVFLLRDVMCMYRDKHPRYESSWNEFIQLEEEIGAVYAPDQQALILRLKSRLNDAQGSGTTRVDMISDGLEEELLLNFKNSLPYVQKISPAIFCRQIFATERGLLGMGSDCVQEGDQVWMLFGGRAPMVLRPTSDPSEFTILGDCYMHGFMHGQAFDEKWGVREKIRKIKIV